MFRFFYTLPFLITLTHAEEPEFLGPWKNFADECSDYDLKKGNWLRDSGNAWRLRALRNGQKLNDLVDQCSSEWKQLNGQRGKIGRAHV